MAVHPVTPRPLSPREAGVLRAILSGEFPGAARFRAQISHATVVATWGAGSPSVDLEVWPGVAAADGLDGLLPVGAAVRGESGEYIGEILIWTTGGYLAAIEYAWVTDNRPDVLPDPAALDLTS